MKVLGEVNGPGHGLDWFRAGGREYVLHSNEGGSGGAGPRPRPAGGDPCKPYPRSTALGWAFEALVSDVTNPAKAKNVSMLKIAINDPDNCDARKASGRDPSVAYHLIDNPMNAQFAAVNFGSAGLRIYDIRQPDKAERGGLFQPRTVGARGHRLLRRREGAHLRRRQQRLLGAGDRASGPRAPRALV